MALGRSSDNSHYSLSDEWRVTSDELLYLSLVTCHSLQCCLNHRQRRDNRALVDVLLGVNSGERQRRDVAQANRMLDDLRERIQMQPARDRIIDTRRLGGIQHVNIHMQIELWQLAKALQHPIKRGWAVLKLWPTHQRRRGCQQQLLLSWVQVAHTNQGDIAFRHWRSQLTLLAQLAQPATNRARQRHTTQITTDRRLGRVEITMRVDPDYSG